MRLAGRDMLQRFAASSRGNMAIIMSVGMGVVAFITAAVVDYVSLTDQKRSLQSIADQAALASAHELIVSTAGDERVQSVATSFVKANYKSQHTTSAQILEAGDAVKVSIVAGARTFFPGPMANVKELTVSATAEVSGGGYVCMIGLDMESVATLNMMNRARLTAKDCAVYSNSLSTKSLWLHDLARVSAELICIGGGFPGIGGIILAGQAHRGLCASQGSAEAAAESRCRQPRSLRLQGTS